MPKDEEIICQVQHVLFLKGTDYNGVGHRSANFGSRLTKPIFDSKMLFIF